MCQPEKASPNSPRPARRPVSEHGAAGLAVRHNGHVHFYEVKSGFADYARFGNVFESKLFRAYLESVGDVGAAPWEVEQDLVKLHLYKKLAPNVGSCLFIMVDAYQGGGLTWSRVFQGLGTFLDTMRSKLVRNMVDRLIAATQITPLRSTAASTNLATIEVHAA